MARRKPKSRSATDEIEALLRPRSIAVVGASANEHSAGFEFVQGLLKVEFPGPVYPVNPKLDELQGQKAYPRLEDIPGPVDFVISAVPAGAALEMVEGAKAKGTKLIHLFTARFSETGRKEGADLEQELRRRTSEAGIRVIGPNCMGVYYPKGKLTFDPELPAEPGNIGFLSQSGGHAYRVVGRGASRGLRFSKVVSYGNALDLNESDFLDHFAQDQDTDFIAAYVEGVRDGRRFFEALRRAAATKPVVVLKGGRTDAGHAAASSHTAALASQQTIWRAAVRQAGAIEVHSISELTDMLVMFRTAGLVKGRRVAVLGGAGGETVEAADLCQEAGLELAPLPSEVREKLRAEIPHAWDWIGNPIDRSILEWGRSDAFGIIDLMAADPTYDAIIANVRGIEHALGRDDDGKAFRETVDRIKKLATENGKPAAIVMGDTESREESRWKAVNETRDELAAAGVAIFPDMERAARTMGRFLEYMAERQGMDELL